MAECERCHTKGYLPHQMHADQLGTMLLGPCCQRVDALPPSEAAVAEDDLVYGVEISSKGLKAYAQWQGLRLEFNRSPAQLKEIMGRIG